VQVVVHKGRMREKPTSKAEAREFILSYADAPTTTVGACVCVCLDTGISYEHVEINKAHIGALPVATVDQLVEEGEVFKCAGGALHVRMMLLCSCCGGPVAVWAFESCCTCHLPPADALQPELVG
jgi:predicted house-cleaning NTP pyrophosphatase (Maf/HAM1 superfamily)